MPGASLLLEGIIWFSQREGAALLRGNIQSIDVYQKCVFNSVVIAEAEAFFSGKLVCSSKVILQFYLNRSK